jgi:repressor LexA
MRDRQQRILSYLREFIEEHDYPPSIRQIQESCGISSTSVVDYNLNALQREGYISREEEVSRGIRLLQPGGGRSRVVQVPIIGTIAAGEPIPVFDGVTAQSAEERIGVDPEIIRRRENIFALRVKGDSMIDDNILDGDIVILQAAQTADDGDTVAAWLPDEGTTTLKRFHHEGDRVRLQPRNPRLAPMYFDAGSVEVQARLITTLSAPA